MATTFSKRKALTSKTSPPFIAPPTPSNIPPMPPPKPDGVPAPFPHTAKPSSVDGASTKLLIGGGKTIVPGTKYDIDPPGNNPSNPAPVHDLTTGKINKKMDL
ncbi:MAG: hypothetical protein AB7K71_12780 [Polyangiaceae bacterium]